MMTRTFGMMGIALALAACTPATETATPAAASPGTAVTARPVEMDAIEVMVHSMDPAARDFWSAWGETYDDKGLHDMSAKTEDDWRRVENGATSVIVAANMLMLPEYRHAPEADWLKHAEKVALIAEQAKEAAEKKDLSVMEQLGSDLDTACEECHKQFVAPVQKTQGTAPPPA